MKVLVVGGTGMIGHRMWTSLKTLGHDVYSICRSDLKPKMEGLDGLDWSKSFIGVDVTDLEKLENIFTQVKPELTINCVGIVKQHSLSKDPITTISMNSLFPHQLSKLCLQFKSRMLQMSTDCVFSGLKGEYSEADLPDATDLYGRSKILGEVDQEEHVITLRTSTIGREISPHGGLVEWFLSQRGNTIKGFTKAIYSGFPTHSLAKIINDYIIPRPELHGVFHVSSEPINKYLLLEMAKEVLEVDIQIEKEAGFTMKRDLNSTLFREKTGMPLMKWVDLINDLKVDFNFYNSLKR